MAPSGDMDPSKAYTIIGILVAVVAASVAVRWLGGSVINSLRTFVRSFWPH